MRKINLVLGIICVLVAILMFAIGSGLGGCVLVLIGALNIIIGLKKKQGLNPKTEPQNFEEIPKQEQRTMIKALSINTAEYYQDNIREILDAPDFTANDIKDMFIDGLASEEEKIYLYDPYVDTPVLEHEPNNEFDPNAIKIMIDGLQVGYVPKNNIDIVNGYLNDNKTFEAEIYAGDYATVEYKEDHDDYFGDDPKRSDLTVKTYKDTFKVSLRIYENGIDSVSI